MYEIYMLSANSKKTACEPSPANAVKCQRIYLRLFRKSFALWICSATSFTIELSISWISAQAFSTLPVHYLAGQGCIPQR